MELLGIGFDERFFTRGDLIAKKAKVTGFECWVGDTGVSDCYDLELEDGTTMTHRFESIMMKEYVPKGSFAFSELFFRAISESDSMRTNCECQPPGSKTHNAMNGAELGVIIDVEIRDKYSKSFPPIVGFCTVNDLMYIPKED